MEVPDWFLATLKKSKACANPRRATKRASEHADGRMRAFTVHPGYAWAIMTGLKDREWRTFLPHPGEGECAIHVSRSYSRAQWEFESDVLRKEWQVELIPYEELVKGWCGKIVGICHYAADDCDLDGNEYGWRLSDVRKLKNPIACKGQLKLWKMDSATAQQVVQQL